MIRSSKGQAGVDPYSIPLEKIDVSDSELFETDTQGRYFERLRKRTRSITARRATSVRSGR